MAPSVTTKKQGALGKVIQKVMPIRKTKAVATATGPQAGEQPVATLRIQIDACKDLHAADNNGKSDPFVAVSFLRKAYQTPAVNATLDPTWEPKDATFEFPVYASLAEFMGPIEFLVWDKDLLKKDYLGEVNLPLKDWAPNGTIAFDDPRNQPFTLPLISTKDSVPTTGVIQLKLGLVPTSIPDVGAVYADLLKRTKFAAVTLTTAPPDQGVGTVRTDADDELEDDGLTDEDTDTDEDREATIASNTPVATLAPPQEKTMLNKLLPAVLTRKKSSTNVETKAVPDSSGATTPRSESPVKRPKVKHANSSYSFGSQRDVLGIVMIEVEGAEDLPKLPNMTRTGWDMDPFTVISFGKKVFRTRVIRHSMNPTWNEKLLFHVRQYESSFNIQFLVLDWDKLSGNDMVAECKLSLADLVAEAPKPDPKTGLYAESVEGNLPMKSFTLPLAANKEVKWDGKHSPILKFKAKYQPYDMLRQRFWKQYLTQYDADNTGAMSRLELTSMLDSLGSTLTRETIDGWFTRFNKSPKTDELSMSEAIQSLEETLSRPESQKKKLSTDEGLTDASAYATPSYIPSPRLEAKALKPVDYDGPTVAKTASPEQELDEATVAGVRTGDPNAGLDTQPGEASRNARVIGTLPYPAGAAPKEHLQSLGLTNPGAPVRQPTDESSVYDTDDRVERIINVKTCPLCHKPRLNSKVEMDIVTHLAVCASGDWNKVDRIVVGNFVTANQARRKWYTQMLGNLTSGAYSLGANSANVLVQNRMTGQIEEEKMQVYVRLGIRLLYKAGKSQMEGARAKRLLKSMSVKQGVKFDDPASVAEILPFIEFHNLDVQEMRDPLDSFKNFNEFFYRKLKEDARPVTNPNDPKTIVSCADCRLMAFESISEATRIWIKGREFSVAKLLGEKYKDEVADYNGGALVIFRLAPQDYHRYHSPVDGKVGPMSLIHGEYYTVNPQAIRTTLDVYGENVRKIVPIDSPTFGRVFNVCIGAMMVGSIVTTVNEGDNIARGQEYGYFAFGGSTIVTLFKKGTAVWDEDLLINGRASLETLVRVGMGIGHYPA